MALITESPILIDPIVFSRSPLTDTPLAPLWGPAERGANVYILLAGQNNACPPYTDPVVMAMWKSTDHGATWAIAGTAPSNNGEDNMISFYRADKTGNISVLYQSNINYGNIAEFDPDTDTWGSPSANLQVERIAGQGPPFLPEGYWFCKNGSDYWFFYNNQARPANKGIYYRRLTAGVWGAETLMVSISDVSSRLMNGFLDESTGDMYITYLSNNTALGSSFLISVSSSGTIGSPVDLLKPRTFFASNATVWGTNFFFSFRDGADNNLKVAVSPISAPVLTIDTLHAISGTQVIGLQPFTTLDKDGNAVAAYIVKDDPVSFVDRPIYMKRNTGSGWGSQEDVWDPVANPATIPGFVESIGAHTVTAIQFSDGAWLFTTALDFDDGSCFPCAGFALITIPDDATATYGLEFGFTSTASYTAAPLVAACPTQRFQIGVVYSSFLTATGGVPPYTWTVQSGTLPAGISLNGATGELSGTPTTLGSGNVTFLVTDSAGTTAIVTCGACVSLTR